MNALELRDVIFKELGRIFEQSNVKPDENGTYQNISFKYSENTLRQYDHSRNPVCDERWRVILEAEDHKIWFGGSVRDDIMLRIMLCLTNYPIEDRNIGNGNNSFPFYGIGVSNREELKQALYTIIVPCIYKLISNV